MAVTKVIELVGHSTESWEDAARNALSGAAKSLHGITKIQVVEWTAQVSDGEIAHYEAVVKVSFMVD
jgi:flavin-binding protein dodecin